MEDIRFIRIRMAAISYIMRQPAQPRHIQFIHVQIQTVASQKKLQIQMKL